MIELSFILFLLVLPFFLIFMFWIARHDSVVRDIELMKKGWPSDSTVSKDDKIRAKHKFPKELKHYNIPD